VLRSWISTWTRRTRPGAVACPSITNWTPEATTRPSIGLTMVVSMGEGAGLVLTSKKATRPVFLPPLYWPSPPTNRPRGVASMALLPSKVKAPGSTPAPCRRPG
jgi:hypothetical protein